MNRICGNCNYNMFDRESKAFICNCKNSEIYGIWTGYDDHCDCWEEKGKLKYINRRKRNEGND